MAAERASGVLPVSIPLFHYVVQFYPFARPKVVLETDRVRCPSHLKKAHQSYLTASYVRPTPGQSERSSFYAYSLRECRAIQE